VSFRRFPRAESSKIPPFSRLWVFLSRIQPKFSGFQFSNHHISVAAPGSPLKSDFGLSGKFFFFELFSWSNLVRVFRVGLADRHIRVFRWFSGFPHRWRRWLGRHTKFLSVHDCGTQRKWNPGAPGTASKPVKLQRPGEGCRVQSLPNAETTSPGGFQTKISKIIGSQWVPRNQGNSLDPDPRSLSPFLPFGRLGSSSKNNELWAGVFFAGRTVSTG
jgi:hypothetical protein